MNFESRVQQIDALIDRHSEFRENSLNLIASENHPSALVDRLFAHELNHRYGNYIGIDLFHRHYQGNRYIAEIEALAHELAKELFGAAYVDLRPLSGNLAGIATTFALARPGDTALEVFNGHEYAKKLSETPLEIDLKSISIPWDGPRYNIDLEKTVSLIERERPRLVTIGSGVFLFRQPVRAIREAMDRYVPDACLIFDAAHVIGLIAGKRFPSPLEEGADVVISSTHKTLAGPQGGLVLTNDESLAEQIGPAIAPLLESNHHLGRIPALAATFLEWIEFGEAHASAVIGNAKALGAALHERGVPLIGEALGYTETHTLLLVVDAFGEGKAVADRLEACNIIAGAMAIPREVGSHGIRMGVQELTRTGMTAADVPEVADCIVDALKEEDPEQVRRRVRDLANRFRQVRFTSDNEQGGA